MDGRVKKAVLEKIHESISEKDEVLAITRELSESFQNPDDIAFGIVLGRVYNSFHYQTRRLLRRSPTEDEFKEFLILLREEGDEIRKSIFSQ